MIDELKQLRDLTNKLIKTDDLLEDQAKSWEYAFDAIPDIVFITNLEGKIKFANKALLNALGITHMKALENFPCILELMDTDEDTNLGEIYIDIFIGWYDHTRTPILDSTGNKLGSICVLRNVTKRRKAEQLLKKSEERFRSIATASKDAIIIADCDATIVYWNRTAEDMFGYTKEEVLGKSLTIIIPEKYRERHLKKFEERKEKVRGKDIKESNYIGRLVKLEGLRKNGTVFCVDLVVSSWRTSEGIFFSGILRDNSLEVFDLKKEIEKN